MTLQVIGTGFGRTGTDSMREALDILGFAPCHHMRSLIEDGAHRQLWIDAMEGGTLDWDKLLGGFGACVDWPSAAFWPELIEAFPEARVLLTWRSAESWWKSYERTILKAVTARLADPGPPGSSIAVPLTQAVFGMAPPDRETAIAAYEANVAKVQREVPAERLLVYRIGDGWDPLCAHLGVPVPEVPFPHANSAAEFNAKGGLGSRKER